MPVVFGKVPGLSGQVQLWPVRPSYSRHLFPRDSRAANRPLPALVGIVAAEGPRVLRDRWRFFRTMRYGKLPLMGSAVPAPQAISALPEACQRSPQDRIGRAENPSDYRSVEPNQSLSKYHTPRRCTCQS